MNIHVKNRTNTPDNVKSIIKIDDHKPLLQFLTCGSVDDGKSTLIGRLLHDTKQIYDDQLCSLKKDSKRYGTQKNHNNIDLALIVDGLQDEREQGITIDVAYRYFSTYRRKFIIADTPGHEQYTRNMVTGASTSHLSILLIDVRKGLLEQTRRHTFISSLLGIKHFIIAINKMDLVQYQEKEYLDIQKNFLLFSKKFSKDINLFFVPVSALVGDNIVLNSDLMPWYKGPTLLHILENIDIKNDYDLEAIRFPVQYINRPNSEFRGYSGMLVSGEICVGQKIKILPINVNTRISRIVTFNKDLIKANIGQAITIVLEDEIDISRGDFFVDVNSTLQASREAIVDVVWMTCDVLLTGQSYNIKLSGKKTRIYIQEIIYKIDINTLIKSKADSLSLNSVACIKIIFHEPMIFDAYKKNRFTGNIIFIDLFTNNTVGAGMIKKGVYKNSVKNDINMQQFELDLYILISRYFPHWQKNKLAQNKGIN